MDTRDGRLQPDLGAGLSRGLGHELGDPAHAAADEPPASRTLTGVTRVIVQQDVRRARRGWPGEAVVDRGPAEGGHHVLRAEPFAEELAHRRREQEGQILGQAPAPVELPRVAKRRPDIVESSEAWIERRAVEERDNGASQLAEIVLEPDERVRVGRGEPTRLRERRLHIVRHQVARAIGVQVQRGAGRIDRDAAAAELHPAPHRLAEHRQDVRAGRGPVSRRELLGDTGSSDDVAPLEDQDAQTSVREREACDQAVVPGADDDRVVGAAFVAPASVAHPRRRLCRSVVDCQQSGGNAPRGSSDGSQPRHV